MQRLDRFLRQYGEIDGGAVAAAGAELDVAAGAGEVLAADFVERDGIDDSEQRIAHMHLVGRQLFRQMADGEAVEDVGTAG